MRVRILVRIINNKTKFISVTLTMHLFYIVKEEELLYVLNLEQ